MSFRQNLIVLKPDKIKISHLSNNRQKTRWGGVKRNIIMKIQLSHNFEDIVSILYPFFDRTFIFDSYSCRSEKGAHKAINRFKYFAGRVSKNNSRTCYILKCDIKRFFANIDHKILLGNLTSQLFVNIYMNEFDQKFLFGIVGAWGYT